MSDVWEESLLPASLGDIKFPVRNRTVKTGRDFTRYKYPYRKGQGVEDVGRKTYVWTLDIPLYAGVSPKHYPGTFDRLTALIEDEDKRGEVEYVDPELGAFDVKIVDYEWDTKAEARNGVELRITLEERAFDQSLLQSLTSGKLSARAAAAKASQHVGYLLHSLEDKLEPADLPNNGFSLTDAWVKTQEALDTAALGADQVAGKIDEFVLVTQKFLDFSAEDEIGRFSIACAIYDAQGAAYAVGDDTARGPGGSNLTEVVLSDEMSAMEVAQRYYGDAGMAEIVLFHNPTANCFGYPRGSRLLVESV
jgi:hypothetical protein